MLFMKGSLYTSRKISHEITYNMLECGLGWLVFCFWWVKDKKLKKSFFSNNGFVWMDKLLATIYFIIGG